MIASLIMILLVPSHNAAFAQTAPACGPNGSVTDVQMVAKEANLAIRELSKSEVQRLVETAGPPPVATFTSIYLMSNNEIGMLLIVDKECVVITSPAMELKDLMPLLAESNS